MFVSRTGMDLAGLRRRTVTVVALIAVALLPLLAGGAVVWSFGARVDTVNGIPVAVVNLDEGATLTVDGEEQTVPMGRELVAKLTQPAKATDRSLVWTLTDQDTAEQGLEDGSYYAVLTIPENYSTALTSAGGDDPEQALVTLDTNDASSLVVSRISEQVVEKATTAVGKTVTKTYLDNVLIGFTDLADGTQQQVTGTTSLADGAAQLADGTSQLADGTSDLADGTSQLADGTSDLADGTSQLADGTSQLATGATRLATGAKKLATAGTTLVSGGKELTSANSDLVAGVKGARDGYEDLVGVLTAHDDPTTVAQADLTLADTAALTATGAQQLQTNLTAVAQGCTAAGGAAAYCAQLTALAEGSAQVTAAAQGTTAYVEGTRASLDENLPNLDQLVTGVKQYTQGVSTYATGVKSYVKGVKQVASGASDLADGTTELADGADQLSDGADQVADGTSELADGADQLSDGADQVADGTTDLADGTQQLADGVAEGADAVPSYTDDERAALVKALTTPVTSTVEHTNAVASGSQAVASVVLPLVLWAGALAAFFVLPAVPRRLALSNVRPVVAAFHGWWPATALGVAQGALLGVTVPLLGLEPEHPWLLGAAVVVAAVVFAAINQAFSSALGTLGRLLSFLLLGLQGALVGGVVPLATAPEAIQVLSAYAPTSLAADLVQRMLLGSAATPWAACVTGLAVWGLLAVAVTVWSVRHRRRAHARTAALAPVAGARRGGDRRPVGVA